MLLPLPMTGSGGLSPRHPPSKRQESWGVIAEQPRYRYTQTRVGGASLQLKMLLRRLEEGAEKIVPGDKWTEEQECEVPHINTSAVILIPLPCRWSR